MTRVQQQLTDSSIPQMMQFQYVDENIGPIALHTQDANAPLLISRVERAARFASHVSVDLRGEISQFATSTQALDLICTEQVIKNHVNPERIAHGLEPIKLSYVLPKDLTPETRPGIADLARLGIQNHLNCLTPAQKQELNGLANSEPAIETDFSYEEDWPEMGEVTLLPIIPLEGTPGTIEPLLSQTRHRLGELLKQGLPGINESCAQQIITFVEESAANVRDHSAGVTGNSKGFIAANRTMRRYRDRRRNQFVEVYTTHVSCYDFGCGVFAALAAVPIYASEFSAVDETDRGTVALRLAATPSVTSILNREGRGGGIPRIINIIRTLPEIGDGSKCIYRGSLRIASHGAVLDFLTTTDCASHDRLLPGTQLQLRFEAVRREDNSGGS
jgi:hypothetical protein